MESFDVMTNEEIKELKSFRNVIKNADFLITQEVMQEKLLIKKKKKKSNNKITFKDNLNNKGLKEYGF